MRRRSSRIKLIALAFAVVKLIALVVALAWSRAAFGQRREMKYQLNDYLSSIVLTVVSRSTPLIA